MKALFVAFFGIILLSQSYSLSYGQWTDYNEHDPGVSQNVMPDWFKSNAKWWKDGIISDQDIINAIENLIETDIIKVELPSKPTKQSEIPQKQQSIPSYVKDTFGFWSDGLVSGDEIGNSIQFLIKEDIIRSEKILEKKRLIEKETKPDIDLEIINTNAVFLGEDPCDDGNLSVSWITSGDYIGWLWVLITKPDGTEIIDFAWQSTNERGIYVATHISSTPGTWTFELLDELDVENRDIPEDVEILFPNTPIGELGENDGAIIRSSEGVTFDKILNSKVFITRPACGDISDENEIGMQESSEDIQDDLLESPPFYIVEKKVTQCSVEEVYGKFELERENGGNIGFHSDSKVNLIIENTQTGERVLPLSVWIAGDNSIEFLAYLEKGTWKIYPEYVIVTPALTDDDWDSLSDEEFERRHLISQEGLDRVLVSGEPLIVEMPCNDTLEVIEYDFQCEATNISVHGEFGYVGDDAIPILDGFYPVFLIKDAETGMRLQEVTAGYGKDVHENKMDVTLPPLAPGRYIVELYYFEEDANPENILGASSMSFEIEIPCGIQIQEDPEPETQYDNTSNDAQCTADPFGYGRINVLDSWSSYTSLGEGAGYEISWGWSLEYENSQYSADGILVNFDPQGPFTYGPPESWSYAYGGQLDLTGWTMTPGTYTFDIVDFENQGSYCGDGDTITIVIP